MDTQQSLPLDRQPEVRAGDTFVELLGPDGTVCRWDLDGLGLCRSDHPNSTYQAALRVAHRRARRMRDREVSR